MKIKVLVDNNTYIDQYYLGEPAVSFYIEEEDKKIVFDLGYSEIYWKNAQKMGIDLHEADTVVFSHGHDDHTGGLTYFCKHHHDPFTIIGHPDCLEYKEEDGLAICAPFRRNELDNRITMYSCRKPKAITEKLYFLGEIPQTVSFEQPKQIGVRHTEEGVLPDYVKDDSALAYLTEDHTFFIITGCSHAGICNIIEYAKKIFPGYTLAGILGGFHLFDVDERTRETRKYLEQYQDIQFYPCHCTSLQVKAYLMQTLPVQEVGVGLQLEIK